MGEEAMEKLVLDLIARRQAVYRRKLSTASESMLAIEFSFAEQIDHTVTALDYLKHEIMQALRAAKQQDTQP